MVLELEFLDSRQTHMEIEQFDNFFHKIQYKSIVKLLESPKLEWKFMRHPSLGSEQFKKYYENSSIVRDSPTFAHFFYRYELPQRVYEFDIYNLFYNKLKSIYSSEIKIYRIRANLTLPCPDYQHSYNPPHVDWEEYKHKTLIYYINTTDGNTVLFDEKFPEYSENNVTKIYKVIPPIENKAIIFDGFRYHAGSPSLTEIRMLINVNFDISESGR